MRLYFKHLRRCIARRPVQPIVLSLVLALSVLVSVFSLTVRDMIFREIEGSRIVGYGEADITISLSGVSSSRFMSSDRAQELIGERGRAIGTYSLAAILDDGSTAFCTAGDFTRLSDFFDFKFSEITPISQSEITEVAYISRSLAEAKRLSVGDSLSVRLASVTREYRVAGIAESRFFSDSDILIDTTGMMRAVTSSSPALSAIADSFKPSSRIFIDVYDGAVEDCLQILSQSAEFSDKDILVVEDRLENESDIMALGAPMAIAVVLTSLLSLAVAFTCLYILSYERADENRSFVYAGAKPDRLRATQYLEIFVYWLLGGSLGLACLVPTVKLLRNVSGFEYAEGDIPLSAIAIGSLAILLVSLLSVLVFNISSSGRRKIKMPEPTRATPSLAVAISYLLCLLTVAILPVSSVFGVFVIFVVLSILLLLVLTPGIIRTVTGYMSRRVDRIALDGGCPAPRLYAPKNLFSLSILQNTARLVAVASLVALNLTIVIGSYFGSTVATENMINGDYAVINASDSCYDALISREEVSSATKLYIGRESQSNGIQVNTLASADIVALSDTLSVSSLPKGNEAILSRAQARMLSLNVGDGFSLTVGGKECELVVSQIAMTAAPVMIFDAEYFGIPYNTLVVNGSEGYSNSEVFDATVSATALEMAAVTELQSLVSESIRPIRVYLRAALFIFAVSLVFMMSGITNNLIESYRSRSSEFELYRLAGMSERDIGRMKRRELLLTFLFGALIGAILFLIQLFAVQKVLFAFGMDLFIGFVSII